MLGYTDQVNTRISHTYVSRRRKCQHACTHNAKPRSNGSYTALEHSYIFNVLVDYRMLQTVLVILLLHCIFFGSDKAVLELTMGDCLHTA